MKKLLRFLVSLLFVSALLAGAAAVVARTMDGPLGPFPGGPFLSGTPVGSPLTNWTFATNIQNIELQLLEPPRSRTTWILVLNGQAFIPCGLPDFRLWNQWPHEAVSDGRALVRIAGKLHRTDLTRVDDPEIHASVAREVERKYGVGNTSTDTLWVFRLDPPRSGSKRTSG
jgi:hypothetical protein